MFRSGTFLTEWLWGRPPEAGSVGVGLVTSYFVTFFLDTSL
jgi:hypothetical protein